MDTACPFFSFRFIFRPRLPRDLLDLEWEPPQCTWEVGPLAHKHLLGQSGCDSRGETGHHRTQCTAPAVFSHTQPSNRFKGCRSTARAALTQNWGYKHGTLPSYVASKVCPSPRSFVFLKHWAQAALSTFVRTDVIPVMAQPYHLKHPVVIILHERWPSEDPDCFFGEISWNHSCNLPGYITK